MQQLQQNNHPKRLKLIGDRAFYKKVLLIAVPIMLQNGITNFVNMLDNIMVGQVGTEQMSGVSIANQLTLVFNMAVFGAVAGAFWALSFSAAKITTDCVIRCGSKFFAA